MMTSTVCFIHSSSDVMFSLSGYFLPCKMRSVLYPRPLVLVENWTIVLEYCICPCRTQPILMTELVRWSIYRQRENKHQHRYRTRGLWIVLLQCPVVVIQSVYLSHYGAFTARSSGSTKGMGKNNRSGLVHIGISIIYYVCITLGIEQWQEL